MLTARLSATRMLTDDKLGFDYADMYLMSGRPPPVNEQLVAKWAQMEALKTEGLTRYVPHSVVGGLPEA